MRGRTVRVVSAHDAAEWVTSCRRRAVGVAVTVAARAAGEGSDVVFACFCG